MKRLGNTLFRFPCSDPCLKVMYSDCEEQKGNAADVQTLEHQVQMFNRILSSDSDDFSDVNTRAISDDQDKAGR